MNTTININLGGNSFCIDQAAYQTLQDYLNSVERNLSADTDKKEVMNDIEARIAELFADLQKKRHQTVISLQMVQIVIEQMGKPDDYKEDETTTDQSFGSKSINYAKDLFHRHLYRDTDNQIIAGVCAGLGHWFGISAVWIRLLFVLCLFLWGSTAIIYIILWLAVPEPQTAAQRLEMRGEETTVDKIEEEIRNQPTGNPQANRSGCANFLVTLLKICVWLIGGFVIFIAAMTLFGIISGLFGALTGLIAVSPLGIFATFFSENATLTVILLIALIIALGLPFFGLFYAIFRYLIKGEHIQPRTVWTGIIIWLLSIVVSIGIGAWQLFKNPDLFDTFPESLEWLTNNDENIPLSQLAVSGFHSVSIQGAADVHLFQNDEQYIEATLRQYDDTTYSVIDSVLYIRTHKKGTNINIYTPSLRNITFSGAAKIKTNDFFTTETLTINAEGASDIDMKINARQLNITASGASEIDLEGNADRMTLEVYGASKVDADDFTTRVCKVTAEGASRVEINATDSLFAYPAGMSKIKYSGTPVITSAATSGGKIIKK